MAPMPAIYDQSLHTAALELKYAQSTHVVDLISKDEDLRRLRFETHILQDDNDELRELLQQEEDRSDTFEKLVNENLARAEEAEAQLQDLETDFRNKEQELQALHAEKNALKYSNEDVTTAVTEKLALTRELSLLKPQLEHLKAQAESAEVLMTEKLALQRQLSNIQCEVENAKREAKRALAKRRNTGVEIAQEEQVEDLKRQLAKEKRARARAEEAAEGGQGDVSTDDTRKQLARERKARQKAEEQLESLQDTTQIEDIRKDLLKEKKAKAKLEGEVEILQAELEREKKAAARAGKHVDGNAQADGDADELRQELAKEKKERTKAEKATQQTAAEYEATKATLEEKLSQFRAKLKSTKDKLRETEAELAAARSVPVAGQAKKTVAAANPAGASKANPKKRAAAQMDPEASTLGTPGDGPAAKRGRKGATGIGDKSTFSMTPFLNKTASVLEKDGEENDNSDVAASPVAKKTTTKQPLAQQPASKANVPPKKPAAQRKPKPQPALAIVSEENEQENAPVREQTLKIKTKTTDGPDDSSGAMKKKSKVRKSITDFATFNQEPEVEKKKKRKLGGLGKTLFDEEDEGSAPARGGVLAGAKGLFGSKGFGAFGGKKTGGLAGSFLGGGRAGSTLLNAGDGSGFQFSPLKKARRNLDDTLRG